MSIETGTTSLMYFTIFPALVFVMIARNKRDKKRGMALFGISLGAYIFFNNVSGSALGITQSYKWLNEILFLIFAFCSLGTLYLMLSSKRSTFLGELFRGKEGSRHREISQRDRLFFHDLINQTHGLNLFLNYKLALRSGVSSEEVRLISKEIKVIQSLMKNHFGLKHKNLMNIKEHRSFFDIKDTLRGLLESYLHPKNIDFSCEFKGRLQEEGSGNDLCLIHFTTFFRIATNLVKNISETESKEVQFIFDYQDLGLNIYVKNRIFHLNQENRQLKDKLQKLILAGDQRDKKPIHRGDGLGIQSINHLCESAGGSFHFTIQDEHWVTEVFLPDPAITQKKAA